MATQKIFPKWAPPELINSIGEIDDHGRYKNLTNNIINIFSRLGTDERMKEVWGRLLPKCTSSPRTFIKKIEAAVSHAVIFRTMGADPDHHSPKIHLQKMNQLVAKIAELLALINGSEQARWMVSRIHQQILEWEFSDRSDLEIHENHTGYIEVDLNEPSYSECIASVNRLSAQMAEDSKRIPWSKLTQEQKLAWYANEQSKIGLRDLLDKLAFQAKAGAYSARNQVTQKVTRPISASMKVNLISPLYSALKSEFGRVPRKDFCTMVAVLLGDREYRDFNYAEYWDNVISSPLKRPAIGCE